MERNVSSQSETEKHVTGPLVGRPSALKEMVEAMPAPIALLDDQWRILAHSRRWLDVFQSESTEAQGPISLDQIESDGSASTMQALQSPAERRLFFDVFDDPDDEWRTTFVQILDEKTMRRGHRRPLAQAEGPTYWVDWEVRPWQTKDNEERGVLLSVVDRTNERQAECMRRQVERRFDALVDTISEGVLLMDDRGVFRDGNEAAQDILGRPLDEIIGSRFDDDIWNGLREDGTPLPNIDFPFWRAHVERETVQEEVMGIYPPDAPPRWIRVNAQPLFEEDREVPYAVLVSFTDITDERLKEEALQTSRDLLSSVLSSSLDGIIVYSAIRDADDSIVDFECVMVNPQAEKLIGSAAEDVVGVRLREAMPKQEEKGFFEDYCEVVESGEPVEREVRYDTDDLDAWFHVMAVKVDDGVAVTYRDITERKEAARAMAAANAKLERRNRALRDFAYIASHDLQEPLRKVRSFSNLVLEDYGDAVDEAGRHYLERMQDAAERMSQLINDLLTYSRITTRAQPFELIDLETVAQNVCNDLEFQIDDVNGTVEIGDLPSIEADPTQMRQLLQNLVGNGLKFHEPGEPPRVRVQGTLEPAAEELQQDGRLDASCTEMCRLTVEDNGIGFEESHADRIFTPFKRLHGRDAYEGTGMGLAICRRIVERHGGHITVSSTPEDGTTFTILLPARRTDEAVPTES
ncbi:ATP-binding protein [Salinibacter sp.]|uniref:ATP-binding protein n=1 Tax=Salinibacter sp. TaxID=2065818 RepID=UPI0035D5212E